MQNQQGAVKKLKMHTCFHEGLQGLQLIRIYELKGFLQNLSIPTTPQFNHSDQLYGMSTDFTFKDA